MKFSETYESAVAGTYGSGAIIIYEDADIAALFPKRRIDLHKGDCGAAAILGGSASVGASVLSARACLKSGAGYTKFFVQGDVLPYAILYPACMLRAYPPVNDEILSADCIAFGMGAGVNEEVYQLCYTLLAEYTGTLILDADALTVLARFGKDILKEKRCGVIVTPHPKEFSRLTGKSVSEILQKFVESAKDFAKEYGVTVALKSHRTVVTDGERVAVNPTGSPVLAKGGSGDVLAGFLAGAVARGLAPFEAAFASCYVLGRAGELAANDMGEYAPDATDIIGYLPKAMLSLRH